MKAYSFDGTFDGLLCCLYRAFTEKEEPFAVYSGDFQPSFDTQTVAVTTDETHAKRVAVGIIKNCSENLLRTACYAMRSGEGLKETVIFNALRKCLAAKRDLSADYADYDMLAFYDLKEKIGKEIHRLKGFVRFEETAGGELYSHISPDNDICDLLAPHFKNRFPNKKFALHDVRRNILVLSYGQNIRRLELSSPLTVYLSDEEKHFKSLWKTYFDSVNIAERKNTRQQDNYLPRRYRINMSEFQ